MSSTFISLCDLSVVFGDNVGLSAAGRASDGIIEGMAELRGDPALRGDPVLRGDPELCGEPVLCGEVAAAASSIVDAIPF